MVISTGVSKEEVLDILSGVTDPEIPAISVVDLGIVDDVEIEGLRVKVTCLPTFVGCPALDVIREDIEMALRERGLEPQVKFVFTPAWTSDRITEQGRRRLEEYGLAPPALSRPDRVPLLLLSPGTCPYCKSKNTVLESPFGPTACRATCYCRDCRNPFEQFKPV